MGEPTDLKIKTTKLVCPQVYSYILLDEPENDGSQKIGYTERNDIGILIIDQARLHGVSTMKLGSDYE